MLTDLKQIYNITHSKVRGASLFAVDSDSKKVWNAKPQTSSDICS